MSCGVLVWFWCGAAAGGGCSTAFKVWCLFLTEAALVTLLASDCVHCVLAHTWGFAWRIPQKLLPHVFDAPAAVAVYVFCVYSLPCSVPHAVKGEAIYAYVTVLDDVQPSPKLHAELVNLVKTQIGSFAAPDVIHWAPGGSAASLHGACVRAVALCFSWFHAALGPCCLALLAVLGRHHMSAFSSRADGSVELCISCTASTAQGSRHVSTHPLHLPLGTCPSHLLTSAGVSCR